MVLDLDQSLQAVHQPLSKQLKHEVLYRFSSSDRRAIRARPATGQTNFHSLRLCITDGLHHPRQQQIYAQCMILTIFISSFLCEVLTFVVSKAAALDGVSPPSLPQHICIARLTNVCLAGETTCASGTVCTVLNSCEEPP